MHTRQACSVEVLIIGAGPAGSAAALALARAGCRSICIVGRRRAGAAIGEAASPDISGLLRRLGLPDHLDTFGHDAHYGIVSAWGRAQPAVNDFARLGAGHGWRLDREAFDRWLLGAAEHHAMVIDGVVSSMARVDGRWCATVQRDHGGVQVRAPEVVLASGRALPAALRFGAPLRRIDRLVAFAVTVRNAPATGQFERFSTIEAVESGWWYVARLPDHSATVMLLTDPDIGAGDRLARAHEFVNAWRATKIVSAFVPPVCSNSVAVTVHPAGTQYLARASGDGWIAAGDALMAFDPLSASGIAGALRDGIEAAATVASAQSRSERTVDARRRYAERANATLRMFLQQRATIYRSERRWASARFWSRRQFTTADPS